MVNVIRFAGFELDETRAELRGPDGLPIRLRPKTFDMLRLFAAHPGKVLSKQDLMEAVWPNVHVGEDGLFQCIREIRAALGDDDRQIIKLVSGRGYLFAPAVSGQDRESPAAPVPQPIARLPRHLALAFAGLVVLALVAWAGMSLSRRPMPTVAISPITLVGQPALGETMATGATDRLVDGLAHIATLRVVTPGGAASEADILITGELSEDDEAWTLRLRASRPASREVIAVTSISVDANQPPPLVQQRLAAGAGDPLARSLNRSFEGADTAASRVVIEQAMASINQTSPERFAAAQKMLETALAADTGNVDLQVALAALQTRGIQMVWYDAAAATAAEENGRALLERALAARPQSMEVLEAQCRLLSATNNFVEALVACARAVSLDPWNGSALYQTGLAQIFLGRFEDALTSFRQAESYDTPAVSRWTWLLGAGWASLLLDRNQQAVDYLERSIAITPGSGRSYMLLAIALSRLGRDGEARAAMAEALALRPGSTLANTLPPRENTSPVYARADDGIRAALLELGLPEA